LRFLLLTLLVFFDRLVPISLFVTVFIVMSWRGRLERIFLWAIILGLMHDVMWVMRLGIMSLFLLAASLMVSVLRQWFERGVIPVVMVTAAVIELIYQWWWGGSVVWSYLVIQAIISGLLWWLLGLGSRQEEVYLKG
jgi:hypothetical protein